MVLASENSLEMVEFSIFKKKIRLQYTIDVILLNL